MVVEVVGGEGEIDGQILRFNIFFTILQSGTLQQRPGNMHDIFTEPRGTMKFSWERWKK